MAGGALLSAGLAAVAATSGLSYDPIIFEELKTAGVRFVTEPCRPERKHQPGVALFDYDNDGWLDIYIVNGTMPDLDKSDPKYHNRLFRNRRDAWTR